MSRQHEFRRYAQECIGIIEDGELPGRHREALNRMAQVWRQLAAEEEQIAEFVDVIDDLLKQNSVGRDDARNCDQEGGQAREDAPAKRRALEQRIHHP